MMLLVQEGNRITNPEGKLGFVYLTSENLTDEEREFRNLELDLSGTWGIFGRGI